MPIFEQWQSLRYLPSEYLSAAQVNLDWLLVNGVTQELYPDIRVGSHGLPLRPKPAYADGHKIKPFIEALDEVDQSQFTALSLEESYLTCLNTCTDAFEADQVQSAFIGIKAMVNRRWILSKKILDRVKSATQYLQSQECLHENQSLYFQFSNVLELELQTAQQIDTEIEIAQRVKGEVAYLIHDYLSEFILRRELPPGYQLSLLKERDMCRLLTELVLEYDYLLVSSGDIYEFSSLINQLEARAGHIIVDILGLERRSPGSHA